jgi:ABC-2 type transport system permease protein
VLAPLAGIPIGFHQILLLLPALILVGFAMTGLGFLVAWPMDSTQGFHAVMNIFLMPLWMMSGALFPMPSGTGWLYWVGALNPVSYSVTAIRSAFAASPGAFIPAGYVTGIGITALFAALMFAISVRLVAKRSRRG